MAEVWLMAAVFERDAIRKRARIVRAIIQVRTVAHSGGPLFRP